MKTAALLVVSFLVTGCAAIAPVAPATLAPTNTPLVVIHTVVVSVIPTWPPTSALPTRTPPPTWTPWIIVVTATPGPLGQTQTAAAASTGILTTATLPANAGGGVFTNLSRSSDHFALRCKPDTITFGVSTSNAHVTGVDFYYRTEDQLTSSVSTWQYAGPLASDKQGNFSLSFAASRVDPDLRSHRAWFDYQFVGTNSAGDAVARSARIIQQITYTIDCSD